MIDPATLVGAVLKRTVGAWHERGGQRDATPVHVWLDLEPTGMVQVHPIDGGLALVAERPYDSYDMGDAGVVVVDYFTRLPFDAHKGQRIIEVMPLCDRKSVERGLVISFTTDAVGIANVGDELALGPWPDDRWDEARLTKARP